VLSDGVEFMPFGEQVILVSGRIECAGRLYVDVRKILDVVDGVGGTTRVQSTEYSYNAVLAGRGIVFRYDSPHDDGHRPCHHVHRYDVLADDKEGTIDEFEADDWPTLGEALEHLRVWYFENYEGLNRLA